MKSLTLPDRIHDSGSINTSLDLYTSKETLTEYPLKKCPYRAHLKVLNTATGLVIPAQCRRGTCSWCGYLRLRWLSWALADSRPEVMLTLTLLKGDWKRQSKSIGRFFQYLRSDIALEWCYVIEKDASGRPHAHVFTHGDALDLVQVETAVRRAGLGPQFDISPTEDLNRNTITYPFKSVLDHPQGSKEAGEALEAHLGLNGGRMEHHSHGFFRDAQGATYGVKEAISIFRSLRRSTEGNWVVINATANRIEGSGWSKESSVLGCIDPGQVTVSVDSFRW